MTDPRDPQERDRWARLRFSIVGPLLAAPPGAGELCGALLALSAKTWLHPSTGMPITFAMSTIERWFYAARGAAVDPVAALKTQVRLDAGRQRGLSPALIEALSVQYRAVELLDFLYELTTAFENAYYDQLHRYYAFDHSEHHQSPTEPLDPSQDPF